MSDKLTIKQRKFLKVYIETGNATEAAEQAYDCKDRGSAQSLGSETLSKLVNGPLKSRMDAAGLTDEYLMSVLHDGLVADKVEIDKYEGAIMDEKAFPDHRTRARYAELVLKWKGELKEHLVHENAVPVKFDGENPKEYIQSKLDE